ncbi:MAG: DUF262 domain-containing protein [Bacteroidetes bacterium]|nr:MAG: DUF262 domain-containing protein [Bacteroidota bacterium]
MLASLEEVEAQIKEIQVEYNYRIADFSIGELMKKFKLKNEIIDLENEEISILIVPQYQRNFIWQESMQSKFVESIFMGVPIQPLFAFELDEDGNMELLDGVQRLSSLRAFVNNKLILNDLEELSSLNGYKFELLETSRKRKLLNTSLKLYIINENTDEGVRADIFRRVNEGGEKLEPAEIRKGKFIGNLFYAFILQCTELPEFKILFSSKKDDDKLRGEKEELITRFFTYSNEYQNYTQKKKPSIFLDDFVIEKGNNFTPENRETYQSELTRTLKFIEQNIPNGFRKSIGSKSIPKVRFEAISIGANLALRVNPNLAAVNTTWLDTKEFKQWTTSDAANNKSKVVGRIEFVRDCLLGKIDLTSLTYDN